MAKSARASTRKANNRRLASTVFGPAEDARRQRLSEKLTELAKQPKPESMDANMDLVDEDGSKQEGGDETIKNDSVMEVDSSAKLSSGRISKRRVDKRKQKKSSIVFTKYSDRIAARKKKSGK